MTDPMKKFLMAAAALAALWGIPARTAMSAPDRDATLKVYNWSSYIADGVIEDFEQWYKEQTGESVHVTYMTFDINEAMLSKIEKGHEDYDVVCPSDYIIERMLNSGLLLPLDFDALAATGTPDYMSANTSPYIREVFRSINPDIDATLYAVPYMWGTTGIIYNTAYVTREEASTWDVIRNPKFAGRILIKDAPRDVYCPVLIYLKRDALASGEVSLEDLMHDSSDESLAAVQDYLMQCRKGVAGFEADLGKEQMTKGRICVSLNWSGDAVWAMAEAASVGVDLDYVVPKEGSTVWFDGWVIPKYARNTKAATYWIDFMSRPDIAIRNMEETGYIASCGAPEVLESQIDESFGPIDLSYFFGDGASSVRVNPVLYPDREVIERCALEHDWGDDTAKLLDMWQNVKGSPVSASTIIVVVIVAVAAVALLVTRRRHGGRQPRSRARSK